MVPATAGFLAATPGIHAVDKVRPDAKCDDIIADCRAVYEIAAGIEPRTGSGMIRIHTPVSSLGVGLRQGRDLIATVQEYSIPLILGVVAGLVFANVDHHLYEQIVEYEIFGENVTLFGRHVAVHFLINEMFMVFFFGIAATEITESVLPGGALNPVRRAINPLVGTLGGVVGPVGVFFLMVWVFYGGSDDFGTVANGWGIPTATDIALAWLVARVVFGHSHPAVSFLLLLAVADDAIGLGIIAVFYPDPEIPVQPAWLLLTVGGMGVALALRMLKVNSWPVYILAGGALSWIGLAKSSVEPALALVAIVPFLPGPHHVHHDLADSSPEEHRYAHRHAAQQAHAQGESGPDSMPVHSVEHGESALERFESRLKLPVDLGLFFFAFANAGVAFGAINQVTVIILVSLIVGKTVGISAFSLAAHKLGFPMPTGMGARHLVVTALIGALGLTVALFVAGKAYTGPPFQDPAKMGAVLSGGVGLLAIILGAVLGVKDGAGHPPRH